MKCKNPACGATVPLVKQTWLCKKKDSYVALKIVAPKGEPAAAHGSAAQSGKRVRFEVVQSSTEKGIGFDPSLGSKGGNTTCQFCGAPVDSTHVKAEGCAKRIGEQMIAIVCTRPGSRGKYYLSANDYPQFIPDGLAIKKRIKALCGLTGLTVPTETIEANPRSMDTQHFGFIKWGDLLLHGRCCHYTPLLWRLKMS